MPVVLFILLLVVPAIILAEQLPAKVYTTADGLAHPIRRFTVWQGPRKNRLTIYGLPSGRRAKTQPGDCPVSRQSRAALGGH